MLVVVELLYESKIRAYDGQAWLEHIDGSFFWSFVEPIRFLKLPADLKLKAREPQTFHTPLNSHARSLQTTPQPSPACHHPASYDLASAH